MQNCVLYTCKFDEEIALQIKSDFFTYTNKTLINIRAKVYLNLSICLNLKVIYLNLYISLHYKSNYLSLFFAIGFRANL